MALAVLAPTSPTRHVFESLLVVYRRTWRGSVITSFLTPVLFLLAMGVGLGQLIDDGRGGTDVAESLGGVDYLTFIAPGLLAATVMQVAAGEAMWPIMGGIRWLKTFHAMVATPVRPSHIVAGHVWFTALRALTVAVVFLPIVALFGAVESPLAVLAIPAAILTGLAFACPIMAWSATLETETPFSALNRFVIQPLFLLSGAFFPVSQLPAAIRPVAWLTPLWHGVELCRDATLGQVRPLAWLGHVAVLAAYTAVGVALANRTFARRLVT